MNVKNTLDTLKTVGAFCGIVLAADKVVEKTTGKDTWDHAVEMGHKIFNKKNQNAQQNA